MLYDRPYMQSSPDARSRNLIFGIILFNVFVFAIQLAAGEGFTRFFELSVVDTRIWAFLTYAFLHHTGGIMHILANMIGVFFLGRAILPQIGEKRFVQLYLGSSVVGGLVWYLVTFATQSTSVVGASGAVFGLITFFALLFGDSDIYFMMVIRMKAKVVMYVSLGIAAFGFIFFELLNQSGTAHSAHLGGMLGGYLFYKFVYARNPSLGKSDRFSMPDWFQSKKKKPAQKSFPYKVNITPTRDLKKEVDRILDKINSKGFGALTDSEKKILDEAGDLLKKR